MERDERDERDRERLYLALHGKMERIKEEFKNRRGAEGFRLAQKKYRDFLESIGISLVRWKKSRKIPPHWEENEKPALTRNSFVIPDPFFNCGIPKIKNNSEEKLGLLIPGHIAKKIIALGLP